MTPRHWRLALCGWWVFIGSGCYVLASRGFALPSPLGTVAQDGASGALLFFVPGATWSLGLASSLAVRLLAAVIASLAIAMAVIGWMVAAGAGFDRQLVLTLLLSAAWAGAASRLFRRDWRPDTRLMSLEFAAGPTVLLLAVAIAALTRAVAT